MANLTFQRKSSDSSRYGGAGMYSDSRSHKKISDGSIVKTSNNCGKIRERNFPGNWTEPEDDSSSTPVERSAPSLDMITK